MVPQTFSKQLAFQRQGQMFHITWQDRQQQRQQIQFTLQQYPHDLTYFSAYNRKQVNQYIAQNLRQIANQQDPKKARVTVGVSSNSVHWQIQTNDPQLQQTLRSQLQQRSEQSYLNYLADHRWRLFESPSGQQGVIPNHALIANQSAAYLKSIAAFFFPPKSQASDFPQQLNALLGFIQSIPYNSLQSRDGYRGAGFMTPIQVIRNNMGDCDSKTTLLAAILLAARPKLKTAMVYMPDHAFLAINWPAQGNEQTALVDQKPWVVADPTGPALLALGEVSAQSRHYLQSRYYRVLINKANSP
ncbi:hypothetical protein [Celerinatantimonas yamalensis]|uniref:Transglutaminase superfamily protein n=1 Tax=Celerinatantimonas yamalensis TaxID=559956 RepID=A0ABW9GAM6_9GAMM